MKTYEIEMSDYERGLRCFERLAAMGIRNEADLKEYFRPPMWLKVFAASVYALAVAELSVIFELSFWMGATASVVGFVVGLAFAQLLAWIME